MISFLLTLRRLIVSLFRKWREPEFRTILLTMMLMLLSGTIFYSTVEGWSLFDSFYFCVITLATIGYGDLYPQTMFGKLFTIIYILVGLGLFVALIHDLSDGLLKKKTRPSNSNSDDPGTK